MEKLKSSVYGNLRFYHPDGSFMFYSDQNRADWYLSRNLAVQTGDREIKLTFTPKGHGVGDDAYGISSKDNICVVCGTGEEVGLTKHHITPRCYRRFFPEEYKSKNSHDVVPICEEHHTEYEVKARELKRKLDKEYIEVNTNDTNEVYAKLATARSFLNCLTKKERCEKIPKERIEFMKSIVMETFNLSELPDDLTGLYESYNTEMDGTRKLHQKRYGKITVSKLGNIQGFVEMWREHFINTMQPKFMPAGWEIKRDARRIDTTSRIEKIKRLIARLYNVMLNLFTGA